MSIVIIFGGALLIFSLIRTTYLNIGGNASNSFKNGASPGEWYWYEHGIYRVGITLHLGAILPAGILIIWQFVPVIRHKALLFHRINGYIIIVLVLIGNIGAVIIARRAFGGTISTQAGIGTLAIISEGAMVMAYINIKRLQIDQHRAWMLRAMFYLGTIITLRIIMIIAAKIISFSSNYYGVMPCGEIQYLLYYKPDQFQGRYPQCFLPNATSETPVVVDATFSNGNVEEIGKSLNISFDLATWMAIFLHLVGVEIYLKLTPRESDRLRQVSYERQLEKGYSPTGSAGLTVHRFGDAEPYRPAVPSRKIVAEKFEQNDSDGTLFQ